MTTTRPHLQLFKVRLSSQAKCVSVLAVFSLLIGNIGHAQPATPATPPAAAGTGPGTVTPAGGDRGRGRAPAAPATLLPLQTWTRPANGPAAFTEDFESGVIDDKIWTVHATGTASVTLQKEMAAHGQYALKITYPAGATRSVGFVTAKVPEALREHFYGRAYMYISGVPDPHSVFVLAGSPGYPGSANWLEIGGYQGHFQPSLQITAATPDKPRGEVPLFQGTLPIGRWFCLEWEFIDKPDRIVVWVDGQLEVNAPFTYGKIVNPDVSKDSGLIGGFFEFSLGYRTFAPGAAIPKDISIYYDDIAIGDKPIGQLTAPPVPAKAN
jgi:hypothetical protein